MTHKLHIFIVTYNRANLLRKTLDKLRETPLVAYPITVLNNCSTDDTVSVVESFIPQYEHLTLITNRVNVTGDGNSLRAIEYCTSEYVWVLADDDDYDFSQFKDVEEQIELGEVDLIHVGAHDDGDWLFGGKTYQIKDLLERGYHYFKYSSFLPCNIIKRSAFLPYIGAGYKNIVNQYPHMPFLQSMYINNRNIYVSKNHIVHAVVGAQDYFDRWFMLWGNTCLLLENFEDFLACLSDHIDIPKDLSLAAKRFYIRSVSAETPERERSTDYEIFKRIYLHLTSWKKILCWLKIMRGVVKLLMRKRYRFV